MADQYRSRGIPQDWVTLEHAGIEGTQTVDPRSVKHWQDRGWKPVKNGGGKPSAGQTASVKES